jgi:hypothetical protein
MHNEIISQQIPGGNYSAQEQVELSIAVVLTAAEYLAFKARDELKTALAQMREPLVHLAAAGLIAAITFSLKDDQYICGVQVTISLYDVADYQEVDLSRLRLLANPEGCGRMQIVCLDGALVQSIVGAEWLPLSSAILECTQVNLGGNGEDSERRKEENDEYNDGQDAGQHKRAISQCDGYLDLAHWLKD